jgi:hypothetical protein
LPTILPDRRDLVTKRSLVRMVINFLFNTFMVLSALFLTFLVLVQEEDYALWQRSSAIEVIERAAAQYWPAGYKELPWQVLHGH